MENEPRFDSTDRRLAVDVVGVAVARLLPEEYKGAYGAGNSNLDRAGAIVSDPFARTARNTLAKLTHSPAGIGIDGSQLYNR